MTFHPHEAAQSYLASLRPPVAEAFAARGYTEAQIGAELARRARVAREAAFSRIAAAPRPFVALPAPNRPLYPPIPAAAFKEAHAVLDRAPDPLPSAPVLIKRIQAAAAEECGMAVIDLLSHRRTANVVLPRQIAMYLARAMTRSSLPQIGRRFGGRDHTTVLHACRKIEAMVEDDPGFAARVAALRARIT